MWTSITLTLLVFASVFAAVRTRRKRQAAARRDSFEESYRRLGFEPPELKEGHTMRSKGKVRGKSQIFDAIIDIATLDNDPSLAARIHTHIQLSEVLPSELTFETKRVLTPYTGSAGQLLHVIKADESTVSMSFHGRPWTGPLRELMAVFSPEVAPWIDNIQKNFQPEPLTTLQLKDGWLTVGRVITQDGWNRRDLSPGEALETYVSGLVSQHAQFAERWAFPTRLAEEPARFWLQAFQASSNFEDWRSQALANLLEKYPGEPASKEGWNFVLHHGNLYDILYIINNAHLRERALQELPEGRLIEFVNGIITQGYRVEDVSKIVSRQFDFDVLLNLKVHWDLRKTLLRLWMGTVQASNLNAVLLRLPTTLTHKELLDALETARELAALGALPLLIATIQHQKKPTEDSLERAGTAMIALSQKHAEAMRQDPAVEEALLFLIKYERPKLTSLAITALREVGGVRALHELKAIADAGGFGLSSIPREAKRASDEIHERLKRDPKAGGMTLSADHEARGGLSVARPLGGLEISEEPADG